jgi:DNA polymerase III gamma/tau subunit
MAGLKKQIVVCESGKFNKLIASDFDRELDSHSTAPGSFALEKKCSGAYLGTAAFFAIKAACADGLFSDAVTKSLSCPDYEIMFDLTDAICKMDKKAVIDVIETAYRNGIDLKQFVKNYNNFVLDLTVYDIIRTFDYIKIPAKYEKRMKSYSKEDFSYFTTLLNEIINLNSAIKYETMPKPIILSTLILLCSEA